MTVKFSLLIPSYSTVGKKSFHTISCLWMLFPIVKPGSWTLTGFVVLCFSAGNQREELHPWQKSWGRRLGMRKGVIKPQETPCSRASTSKPESVLCSHLHLWLYGGLSPITVSLGEGVNVQLQGNKNSWAWQELFQLTDSSEGYLAHLYRFVWPHVIIYSLPTWEARDVLDLLKANSFGELEIVSKWVG